MAMKDWWLTLSAMRARWIFACFVLGVTVSAIAKSAGGDPFASSTQLIVVTTPDWDAVDGRMQRYERRSPRDPWQPAGDSFAIVVGKHGLGWGAGVLSAAGEERNAADPVKKEGDGKSPAGIFELGTAFGDASKPLDGSKMQYLELTPSIECVDDVNSQHYNRLVDRSKVASADWKSSEHMRDTGEAYRLGIVVDHNGIAGPASESPLRGGGSCIFLHLWQGPGHGTAGCTAMAPDQMEGLLRWLGPKRRPLLVQLTAVEYARAIKTWKLPNR
jgi:D-alanyl-D-alanine dipeptidase